MDNKNKLTSWEWDGLTDGHNIADGHAHQEQSKEYEKIIKRLPLLYLAAEKLNQRKIQNRFEEIFFTRAGQKSYKKLPPPLYQAACSLSIEVVANYLRLTNKSVALLHPTFDNLADILKRHAVPIEPLSERALENPVKALKKLKSDALFLVCPNNPTGTEITKSQYKKIIAFCKKYQKLLIIDSSFRFYSNYTSWDQYAELYKSGSDFIVLEDTGKTWPTLELKMGITVASKSVYPYLADITNDFLLNVSPFNFLLLSEYIKVDLEDAGYYGAKKIVAKNREVLKNTLKDTPLTLINPDSNLSVGWIKLPKLWKATEFCEWLSQHHVHVLPGSPFYWNDHKIGESYIRVALLRPEKKFVYAMIALQQATQQYAIKT